MDFLYKLTPVLSIEIALLLSFFLGMEVNQRFCSNKKKPPIEKHIDLPDDILDPVSPADQKLDRKLEEEAKSNARYDEEDED